MPNWCTCNLVVTGPLAETRRLQQRLAALPLSELDNPLVVAASPADVKPLQLQPDPVSFHTLLPPPPTLAVTEFMEWQQGAWGTKWEPGDETRDESEPGRLVYHFSTAWGPPDRWVRTLAEAYPALGIALHFVEPGSGTYVTHLYRAGSLTHEIDFAGTSTKGEWLDSIFGWSDDDEDDQPEADLPDVAVIEEAEPAEGVQESDFLLLAEASSADDVARVEARWEGRGVAENVRLTLLADHAPHLEGDVLARILREPGPARRLILREAWPAGVAEGVAEWASAQVRAPMPPRPSLPIDVALAAIRKHAAGIAAMIEESLSSKRQIPGLAEYQAAVARMDLMRMALERLARDRAATWAQPWVQDLAPLLNTEESHARIAVGSFLTHVHDTPAEVLARIEATLPVDGTKLGDLLLLHPRAPMRLRRRRLEAGTSTGALLRLLATPRLRRTPSLRRAILAANAVHPVVLAELARDAAPPEFGAAIERLLAHPRFALMAIERADDSQREAVPAAAWAQLLDQSDFDVRQRAMVNVRQPAGRKGQLAP